MAKTEKTPPEFDTNEILVMLNVVAKIATKLQNIRKAHHDPKELAVQILKDLKHKKNLAQTFITFNFNNMDPARFYSPLDFKNEIAKQMKTNVPNDSTDILTALADESKTKNDYVSSNDISKALKTLKKEMGLINITGKKKIKKGRGTQKIEFLGRPSLWQIPSNSQGLRKIMSKPKAIELIFKSLVDAGLLPHLEFLWEASFHVIREQARKQNVYELAKSAERSMDNLDVKIDKESLGFYRNLLLSIPEDRLRLLAHQLCKRWVCDIPLCRSILLLGIYVSP